MAEQDGRKGRYQLFWYFTKGTKEAAEYLTTILTAFIFNKALLTRIEQFEGSRLL